MICKLLNVKNKKQRNVLLCEIFQKQQGVYNLIEELYRTNNLKYIFPHISRQSEVYQWNIDNEQNYYPDSRKIHLEGKTVLDHTIQVLKYTKSGNINAWCSLFHDIGKTNLNRYQTKEKTISFPKHDEFGSKYIKNILKNYYQLDDEIVQIVSQVCKYHMKIYNVDNNKKRKMFIKKMSNKTHRQYLYNLCKADTNGTVRSKSAIFSQIDDKFIYQIEKFDI